MISFCCPNWGRADHCLMEVKHWLWLKTKYNPVQNTPTILLKWVWRRPRSMHSMGTLSLCSDDKALWKPPSLFLQLCMSSINIYLLCSAFPLFLQLSGTASPPQLCIMNPSFCCSLSVCGRVVCCMTCKTTSLWRPSLICKCIKACQWLLEGQKTI